MPEVTFEIPENERVTIRRYAIIDRNGGLVREVSEAEAKALAETNPRIRELLEAGKAGESHDG